MVMFDVKERQEVRRVGMPSHVAAVKWHPKINQIFVGIGERHIACAIQQHIPTDNHSMCSFSAQEQLQVAGSTFGIELSGRCYNPCETAFMQHR